jgi:hypothetical protein
VITHAHIIGPPERVDAYTEHDSGYTFLTVETADRDRLCLSDSIGTIAPRLREWADQVEAAEGGAVIERTVLTPAEVTG